MVHRGTYRCGCLIQKTQSLQAGMCAFEKVALTGTSPSETRLVRYLRFLPTEPSRPLHRKGESTKFCRERSGYASGRSPPIEACSTSSKPHGRTVFLYEHNRRKRCALKSSHVLCCEKCPPLILFSIYALGEVVCKSRAQKRAHPSAGDGNPKFPLPIKGCRSSTCKLFIKPPASASNGGTEASVTTGDPHRTARPT